MKLSEWKENQELVQWSNNLQQTGEFDILRGVLESEHPKESHDPRPTDGIGAAIEYGMIKGYDRALKVIQSTAMPAPPPMPQITAKFEPEEQE